ncbi:MAG: hypothetical protein KA297_15825 [Kofleriaceae bacterium]|nr:hypothetical protein [Kofleriaceae bacterium]MBP6836641.1 hypothetical protein [Kofleriaceae bacterium]
MKKFSIALVATLSLASLAACGKKGGGAGDCDAVVGKLSGSMAKQMTSSLPADKATKWTGKLKEVMTASCKEDKWPSSIMSCVMKAKDDKAIDACGDGMKGDKAMEEKMMKRMQPLMDEMMKDMMGAMGGAAGGDPAGAGAGSAEVPAAGSGDTAGSAAGSAAPAAGSGDTAGSAAPAAGSGETK